MSDTSPTDPSSDELRRLLRTDELGVDPAQRERAIGAALAAADELTVDPNPPDGPVLVPFAPRRDHRRLRHLATAAAVLLVFAGVASVIVNPLSGGGQDSSEESATELSTGAADSAADAQAGAGGAGEQTISTTTMVPTMPAESAARADEDFAGFTTGLVDLGEFDDAQSVLAAAPAAADSDASASPPAADQTSACGLALVASGSVPVAVARIGGAPVLVVRSSAAGAGTDVSVLSSPDCTLLASG